MSDVHLTRFVLEDEHTAENEREQRYTQFLQQLEQALSWEAATLRLSTQAVGIVDASLAAQAKEAAIRLDSLAWAIRNFDPDEPISSIAELAARAGMLQTPVAGRDLSSGDSGKGTLTDLGEGPVCTDTGGDADSPTGA